MILLLYMKKEKKKGVGRKHACSTRIRWKKKMMTMMMKKKKKEKNTLPADEMPAGRQAEGDGWMLS
jgi:hypothetical protein